MDENQIALNIMAQQRNTALDGLVHLQVQLTKAQEENTALKAEIERLQAAAPKD